MNIQKFDKVLCVKRGQLSLTVGKWYNLVRMSNIPYDFYIYDDWNIRCYLSKDEINNNGNTNIANGSLYKNYFITEKQERVEKLKKLNEICQKYSS